MTNLPHGGHRISILGGGGGNLDGSLLLGGGGAVELDGFLLLEGEAVLLW